MNTYKCHLVNKGICLKSFYRNGESIKNVLDGLSMDEWPEGNGLIIYVTNINDDDQYKIAWR